MTPIYPCEHMSSEPLPAALLFFVASKVFDGPSLSHCYTVARGGFTILSRLDYGSTVLFGLPQLLVDKLQSVQNAAARLIFAARRRDHISPLLQSLHWLRVADRITFRLAVLTYTTAFTAQHLSTCRDNCREFLMSKHVNDFVLRRPPLLLFRGPAEPPSAVDVSLLLQPQSGIACQKQTVLQHLWRFSESH